MPKKASNIVNRKIMNGKKNTQKSVEETLEMTSTIEKVHTPAYFKERTLNRLTALGEVEEPTYPLGWLLPKYQIAALLVLGLLNFGALYLYNEKQQEQKLDSFAQNYGLYEDETDTILN